MPEQRTKVLIVDDEEIVRHGLEKIIDWEKLGCTVCGEAASGSEALEKLEELSPSIVLLDINMPGKTGIDVLERVHGEPGRYPSHPKFLILSGYSDFEYARKAINFGASGYLVKPVDEDELEEKIRSIRDGIKKEAEAESLRSTAEKEEMVQGFHQMFLYGAVEDGFSDGRFDGSTYQVAIVSPELAGCTGRMQALQSALDECFMYVEHFSFPMDSMLVAVFCNEGEETVSRHLERLCTRLQNDKSGAVAALGHRFPGLGGGLESYNQARELYRHLFFFTQESYITMETLRADGDFASGGGGADGTFLERIPELVQYIEIYDLQKIDALMAQMRHSLRSGSLPVDEIKKLCMAFIVDTQNAVRAKHPEKELETVSALDLVNLIYTQNYFDEMMSIVRDFTSGIAESFASSTPNSTILKVIQYVKSNYRNELKLEMLGDLFNCNSAYLGKKFKEYTGVPFNTYLDIIRIEQAKAMLSTSSLKIYEISKLVGYSNTDYFYLKFKKHTNMTPKEFKKAQEDAR